MALRLYCGCGPVMWPGPVALSRSCHSCPGQARLVTSMQLVSVLLWVLPRTVTADNDRRTGGLTLLSQRRLGPVALDLDSWPPYSQRRYLYRYLYRYIEYYRYLYESIDIWVYQMVHSYQMVQSHSQSLPDCYPLTTWQTVVPRG